MMQLKMKYQVLSFVILPKIQEKNRTNCLVNHFDCSSWHGTNDVQNQEMLILSLVSVQFDVSKWPGKNSHETNAIPISPVASIWSSVVYLLLMWFLWMIGLGTFARFILDLQVPPWKLQHCARLWFYSYFCSI